MNTTMTMDIIKLLIISVYATIACTNADIQKPVTIAINCDNRDIIMSAIEQVENMDCGPEIWIIDNDATADIIIHETMTECKLGCMVDDGLGLYKRIYIQEFNEQIVVHELLHALGLEHVDDPADVMYPTYGDRKITDVSQSNLCGLE